MYGLLWISPVDIPVNVWFAMDQLSGYTSERMVCYGSAQWIYQWTYGLLWISPVDIPMDVWFAMDQPSGYTNGRMVCYGSAQWIYQWTYGLLLISLLPLYMKVSDVSCIREVFPTVIAVLVLCSKTELVLLIHG